MSSGFTYALVTGKVEKVQAKTGITRIFLNVAEYRKGRDGAEGTWVPNIVTCHIVGDAWEKASKLQPGDRAEVEGLVSQYKYKEGEKNRSRIVVTAFNVRQGGPLNQNVAIVMGRHGRDPDFKTFTSGNSQYTFSLAADEWDKHGGSDGKGADVTHWIDVRLIGKRAEAANRLLGTGKMLLVKGQLVTDTWEKDGEKHSRTFVKTWDFRFAGSGAANAGTGGEIPDMPFEDDFYASYEDALENGRVEGQPAHGREPGDFPQGSGGADLDDEIPF